MNAENHLPSLRTVATSDLRGDWGQTAAISLALILLGGVLGAIAAGTQGFVIGAAVAAPAAILGGAVYTVLRRLVPK